MVKNRDLRWDNILDPYEAGQGWLPWSYFYAIYEKDEVALFWSSMYGAAAAGGFIGHALGAGGYSAFGGWGAFSMLKRFSPVGAILTSTQLQHYIGTEMGIEHEVAMNYAATGDFGTALPVVPGGWLSFGDNTGDMRSVSTSWDKFWESLY